MWLRDTRQSMIDTKYLVRTSYYGQTAAWLTPGQYEVRQYQVNIVVSGILVTLMIPGT